MVDDAELLRQYAMENSQAAFTELVHRHVDLVYGAALRRVGGDVHWAADVTQIVFTSLARKSRAVAGHPSLAGWLHASTRYAAIDLLRKEQRRAARETFSVAMNAAEPDEPHDDWTQLRPWLDDALDALPPPDRDAILLRFFSGQSWASIADRFSVSEDAARHRVERGLERLRTRLLRRGVTSSAAAISAALTAMPATAAPAGLATTVAATALTAAAAGGSLGSALIGFMSTLKASGACLTVCSLVGIATFVPALIKWSQQQQLEQRQLDASLAQASAIRLRLGQLERDAKARSNVTATAGRSPTPDTSTPDPNRMANEALREQQIRESSREYAPFREEGFRLQVQGGFGSFFATRNYPPDKLELVRTALASFYAAEREEIIAFLLATPGTVKKPDTNRTEQTQRLFDELRPQLGDEETDQLRRYFAARRWVPTAREVSLDLADAGNPLSNTQEMALAMVIADAAAPTTPAMRERQRAVDPNTGLTGKERAQLDDATVFLTPAQIQLFERYLRDERARSELLVRARNKIRPPSR